MDNEQLTREIRMFGFGKKKVAAAVAAKAAASASPLGPLGGPLAQAAMGAIPQMLTQALQDQQKEAASLYRSPNDMSPQEAEAIHMSQSQTWRDHVFSGPKPTMKMVQYSDDRLGEQAEKVARHLSSWFVGYDDTAMGGVRETANAFAGGRAAYMLSRFGRHFGWTSEAEAQAYLDKHRFSTRNGIFPR